MPRLESQPRSNPQADAGKIGSGSRPNSSLAQANAGADFHLVPVDRDRLRACSSPGRLIFVPLGVPLLVWGYLQYLYVGSYRLPRAGGTAGMDVPPERIITQGPYRFTRNPMYLGHLTFMLGLTLTFWSWLALVIFTGRAYWFHRRVLHDEARLEEIFGAEYAAYRAQVKRWIPGLL